jgi:hypothetical protein
MLRGPLCREGSINRAQLLRATLLDIELLSRAAVMVPHSYLLPPASYLLPLVASLLACDMAYRLS